MPAYGSIYSAGNTPPSGSATTVGVRKGRPRKRKGTDGGSLHDTHSPGAASSRSAQSPTLGMQSSYDLSNTRPIELTEFSLHLR